MELSIRTRDVELTDAFGSTLNDGWHSLWTASGIILRRRSNQSEPVRLPPDVQGTRRRAGGPVVYAHRGYADGMLQG